MEYVYRRFRQTRPISDRISRALRQDLLLLHRSHSTFFVLGATGNVYTVTLATWPSCTCPDPVTPCKHIFFVYIRVLGVSLDDLSLPHSALLPSELRRLLDRPTSPEAIADAALCQKFHQLFFTQGRPRKQERPNVDVKDGTSCPICLEEMKKEEKIVACGICRNPIHEECFEKWKESKINRVPSCVICRAPWCDRSDVDHQHTYLNLSAFTSQQDDQN